jgi:hydroxymethylbilane synthase
LKRLDQGDYSGIILAGAGLKRMQMSNRITAYLSIEESLPAAGQGALGIECRSDDHATQDIIRALNHEPTYQCVAAERAVCRELNGGCQTPLAAFADMHHHELTVRALVANRAGTKIIRTHLKGDPRHAESLGTRVAEELRQQGAEKILREFHER